MGWIGLRNGRKCPKCKCDTVYYMPRLTRFARRSNPKASKVYQCMNLNCTYLKGGD